jgi:hypothetical protein
MTEIAKATRSGNEELAILGYESRLDSRAMKVISVASMVYLPATFAAVSFARPFRSLHLCILTKVH